MSDHDQHDDHHHDDENLDRRGFLRMASLGLISAMAGGFGLPGIAIGQTAGTRPKTVVKVFMRGGCDGLHLFPPVGDAAYYMVRPNANIKPPSGSDAGSAIRLSTRFGLNPNLQPLMEIWNAGRMAIAMSTHFAEGNRSHFDCQRWIELGARNQSGNLDGLYNRYLQSKAASHPLSGVSAGTSGLAVSLQGSINVPSINEATNFQLRNSDLCSGTGCSDNRLTTELRKIIEGPIPGENATRQMTRRAQKSMLEASDVVTAAAQTYTGNTGTYTYSNSSLGRGLKLVSQLLKGNIPVQVAAVDWSNSWDTHENLLKPGEDPINQANGYHRGLQAGAQDLVAFYRDLGPLIDDVVVIVGSEFGRTVRENGSFGTDHGNGGAWFAFGGPTAGGIYGEFGSLDPADNQLLGRNYLPVVMNYKDITAEVMIRHLGLNESQVSTMFPGHTFTNYSMFSRTV